jgi:hypothetical protein
MLLHCIAGQCGVQSVVKDCARAHRGVLVGVFRQFVQNKPCVTCCSLLRLFFRETQCYRGDQINCSHKHRETIPSHSNSSRKLDSQSSPHMVNIYKPADTKSRQYTRKANIKRGSAKTMSFLYPCSKAGHCCRAAGHRPTAEVLPSTLCVTMQSAT